MGYEIATEKTYLVLKERGKRGELEPRRFHRLDEAGNPTPGLLAYRRGFALDADDLSVDETVTYPVNRFARK